MERKNKKTDEPNMRLEFLARAIDGRITWEHFIDLINALDELDQIMGRAAEECIN